MIHSTVNKIPKEEYLNIDLPLPVRKKKTYFECTSNVSLRLEVW